uniref:NADH dehydrogenase subunit 6 n=1 Tax=Ichthyoxenos japonensis TaxID=2033261 RepID=UPI000EF2ED10|nr:NADH dehydrogenase subunit 6 [Ichthyoxenos japonensis]ATO58531.1 NADH dehydrogenase subunit 6 [Ichthyoxenos japonensis]
MMWLMLTMTTSLTMIITSSPHFLALFIILNSILLSLLLSFTELWYSLILILIFTGGLMILILYTITMTFTNITTSNFSYKPVIIFMLFNLITALLTMSNSPLSMMFNTIPFFITNLNLTSSSSMSSYILTTFYLLYILLLLMSLLKKEKMSMRLYK